MELKLLDSKKIGLVLSGGGVRGMAHIGLLKAMQEHGIEASTIAGSSVGALVGALYAKGYATDDMLTFFRETPIFQYSFFAIGKPGFIDTAKYFTKFKTYFPEDSFEALKKPLYLVATDLMRGEEVMFSKGELIRPLLASAALTPIFSPIEINGVLYADGGIMNNFPKEYIEDHCEIIIGSNVSISETLPKKELSNMLQLAGRVTALMIYAACRDKLRECDIMMEPRELYKIGVLDKKGIDKAYNIGYDSACRAIDEYLSEQKQHSVS
ncbi:MAG: patatin-like phospholipase family protein [Croceitalea sp.]|nr:patatin-like phospholipase family protein [Croceitalea sp.]NNC33922.1 patatin-like phospholipase family protein [Croceitalea sp.]NNM17335.1 patatin-like phospholipase family protein [Croceitalea sp.]